MASLAATLGLELAYTPSVKRYRNGSGSSLRPPDNNEESKYRKRYVLGSFWSDARQADANLERRMDMERERLLH